MRPRRFEALVAEARALAEQAIEQVWPQYGRELQNIEVVVADEPPPETLREMGMSPPETLYGLYDGIPLNERGWDYGNALPDVISIFRGPIVRDCEDEDEIVQEVSFTIVHEFAHYVGKTEEEIQEIEDRFWYADDGADGADGADGVDGADGAEDGWDSEDDRDGGDGARDAGSGGGSPRPAARRRSWLRAVKRAAESLLGARPGRRED